MSLAAAVALLLALVVTAPWWLGPVGVVSWALQRAAEPTGGTLLARSVDWGWFSPVVVHELELRAPDGHVLMQAPRITVGRTGWQLIWNRNDLGTIRVEQPKAAIQVRRGGSDLEDALAGWLAGPASGTTVRLQLEIRDGQVEVEGSPSSASMQLSNMDLALQTAVEQAGGTVVQIKRCHVATQADSGQITGQLTFNSGPQQADTRLTLTCQSFPLSVSQLIAARFGQQVHCTGRAWGTVEARRAGRAQAVWLRFDQCRIEPIQIAAVSADGPREWTMPQLLLKGDLALNSSRIEFHELAIESAAVNLAVNGTAELPEQRDSAWRWATTLAERAHGQLEGSLDLKALGSIAPQLIRLRAGTSIEQGHVQFLIVSNNERDEPGWRAELRSSDFRAQRDGRAIVWNAPLEMDLAIGVADRQWRLRQLRIAADFAEISGQGSLRSGSVTARINLNQLTEHIRQVVDLEGWQLAGQTTAQLQWAVADNDLWSLESTGLLDGLDIRSPTRSLWSEPRLSLAAHASGRWTGNTLDGGMPQGLATGGVQISDGRERFSVELVEPTDSWSLDHGWRVQMQLLGSAQRWRRRFAAWLPSTDWDLRGELDLRLRALVSGEAITIEESRLRAEPLHLEAAGWTIDEPAAELSASGSWSRVPARVTVDDATLQTETCAARLVRAQWVAEGRPGKFDGTLSYRVHLDSWVEHWVRPGGHPNWRAGGELTGQATIVTAKDGRVTARWSGEIQQAQLASRAASPSEPAAVLPARAANSPWRTIWQEPSVQLRGTMQLDPERGQWHVQQVQLDAGEHLQLAGSGTLQPVGDTHELDLRGQLQYDLATLRQRWSAWLPQDFDIRGRDRRSFTLHGRLDSESDVIVLSSDDGLHLTPRKPQQRIPTNLTGAASIGWQGFSLFGISGGAGDVAAHLEQGTIAVQPIDLPLSGGRFRATLSIDLNREVPVLTLPAGTLLDQVQITPAMCRGWLHYVAPMIANATRAAGTFSLGIQESEVLIGRYDQSQAAGQLTIHQAQVGAGGLAAPLINALQRIRTVAAGLGSGGDTQPLPTTWDLPPQQVPFRLANGRVHHQRFLLRIGTVTMETSGSVGLDQSLDLMATIPLESRWSTDPRWQALAAGKTVQIAIRGTVDHPQFDIRAVEQLARHILGDATRQLLEKGLQEGLGRLLGPSRQPPR